MAENENVGETPEIQDTPEVSIDDTIRETLSAIQSRESDEPESALHEPEKVAEPVKAQEVAEAVVPDVADPSVASSLPNTWKKEASDAWAKADPILKAEVLRREADIHKGIEQYKQAADFAYEIDRIITPHKGTLEQLGVTPQKAVEELMKADHILRFGKQEEKEMYFYQLSRNYGIDISRLSNTVQNTDPRVLDLHQRNQYLEQNLIAQKQEAQRQIDETLNSEITNFASDPKHAHFETVKGHMAALLQAGQATNLSDAYEQAIYANPVTRAAVLQQQTQVAKEEAARKAQAARQASGVNLRSRPPLPSKLPIGSMDDTIRETLRRMQSA